MKDQVLRWDQSKHSIFNYILIRFLYCCCIKYEIQGLTWLSKDHGSWVIIDKFVANKELQRAAQTQRDDKKCVMCAERERLVTKHCLLTNYGGDTTQHYGDTRVFYESMTWTIPDNKWTLFTSSLLSETFFSKTENSWLLNIIQPIFEAGIALW